MKGITIRVSDDLHRTLEVEKERYGTWKIFLLGCVISKFRRSLAYPGYQEHKKRWIRQIQQEIGAEIPPEPKVICPHCLKEF